MVEWCGEGLYKENEACRDTQKAQVQDGTALEETNQKAITIVQVRCNEGLSQSGGSDNEEFGKNEPAYGWSP